MLCGILFGFWRPGSSLHSSSFISNIKGYYGLASLRFNMLNEAARKPRDIDTDHDWSLAIPHIYSVGTLAKLHQCPHAIAVHKLFYLSSNILRDNLICRPA